MAAGEVWRGSTTLWVPPPKSPLFGLFRRHSWPRQAKKEDLVGGCTAPEPAPCKSCNMTHPGFTVVAAVASECAAAHSDATAATICVCRACTFGAAQWPRTCTRDEQSSCPALYCLRIRATPATLRAAMTSIGVVIVSFNTCQLLRG